MLDLIRLANDRWLVRAVAARRDGSTVALEEILVGNGMPNIEAVIDVRGAASYLVLRGRHDPDRVIAERSIEPVATPLRVVWDASRRDITRTKPVAPIGPPLPA